MNAEIINYVLCVITGENHVLLIKKSKGWQAGLYNFIGGKVEYYDNLNVSAAIRETKEECGLNIYNFSKKGKIIINCNSGDFTYTDSLIHVYHADIGQQIREAKTTTEEQVSIVPIEDFKTSLYRENSISNIHAILDLILDDIDDFTLEYVNEK